MRSKKITLTIPHRLWEALETHAVECGYANARQFLTFAPLYSLTVCKPHHATAPIAAAPPAVQDEIIESIVSAYERGESKHGSYFERVLVDVVEKFKLPVPPDVVGSMVGDAIKKTKGKK